MATILVPVTALTRAHGRSSMNGTGLISTTQSNAIQWVCPACNIPFKTASGLQSHLSAHTKAESSVPCPHCGKKFVSSKRVRIHIKVEHGEKSCSCEVCGASFTYRCKLLDHMRTHSGDKPFVCEECGRGFSQKNHLHRHQMIHTGERPYSCEFCGRGFYRKDKLDRHKKIHTKGLLPETRKSRGSRKTNQPIPESNEVILSDTHILTQE